MIIGLARQQWNLAYHLGEIRGHYDERGGGVSFEWKNISSTLEDEQV